MQKPLEISLVLHPEPVSHLCVAAASTLFSSPALYTKTHQIRLLLHVRLHELKSIAVDEEALLRIVGYEVIGGG